MESSFSRLSSTIQLAKDFGIWLHEKTNERNIPGELRERVGISILQHSLDIDDAIIVLLETKLPGPAMSLARPLFESYIRGVWLLAHASDEQVDAFVEGKCPSFFNISEDIGNGLESGGAWIHANRDANLTSFHNLTHGGSEHVIRRNKECSVEPAYPERELESLVRFGIEVRIRIGAEILALMNDEAAMEELREKAHTFRGLT